MPEFSSLLLKWYRHYHRELPWRRTKDPYLIWISEIILQQTRIEQGLKYYFRFTERFPTLPDLANASEDEVLKLWQGLGYYTRARNLHEAARVIMTKYNGQFPEDYDTILGIRGIGPYTAAAISSIVYNLPYPVVDGNVLRFISRYFGITEPVNSSTGKNAIRKKAEEIIDKNDPGTFNQAVMEFGALHCKPQNPDCKKCPFRNSCFAFTHHKVNEIPVHSRNEKQRNRYFHYFVFLMENELGLTSIYIRKREKEDIWKGLYEFPLIETEKSFPVKKLISSNDMLSLTNYQSFRLIRTTKIYRHILSHQVLHTRFYLYELEPDQELPFLKVTFSDLKNYPVPRLIDKMIQSEW